MVAEENQSDCNCTGFKFAGFELVVTHVVLSVTIHVVNGDRSACANFGRMVTIIFETLPARLSPHVTGEVVKVVVVEVTSVEDYEPSVLTGVITSS